MKPALSSNPLKPYSRRRSMEKISCASTLGQKLLFWDKQ